MTRYRHRTTEVEAVQWTGANADALRAFAGADFDEIELDDRVDDPDETAAVREADHGTWRGLKPGDWVVKLEGGLYEFSAADFASQHEAVSSAVAQSAPAKTALRDWIATAVDGVFEAWRDGLGDTRPQDALTDAVLAVLRGLTLRELEQLHRPSTPPSRPKRPCPAQEPLDGAQCAKEAGHEVHSDRPGRIWYPVADDEAFVIHRAAVLREVADRYQGFIDNADTGGDPRYWTGIRDMVIGLRHLADEERAEREAQAHLDQLADELPAAPDDTDLTEADVDRMMAAGVPVQIVTAPPATFATEPAVSSVGQAAHTTRGADEHLARVHEWVTSDVVTARNEFGNGYREAQRDIRDLLAGRRMADETQPAEAEAHPPTHAWKVESPRRDKWASWGAMHDERVWAAASYDDAIEVAPQRPFRLVRATTTYAVEAEHQPVAGPAGGAQQPKEVRP